MRRMIITSSLLLALSTSVAHAQQNMVSVAGSTLNMREGPGTGSPVLWARALQASLRCGTHCGSCVPELKRLVRATPALLPARGLAFDI